MSLSVLILVLLTCSNLCNCALLPPGDGKGDGNLQKTAEHKDVPAVNIDLQHPPKVPPQTKPDETESKPQGNNPVDKKSKEDEPSENEVQVKKPEEKKSEKKPENVPAVKDDAQAKDDKQANINDEEKTANDGNGKSNKELKFHKKFNHNAGEMDSSSLKRLVLVLVALSIVFIMYLAFKTYRFWSSRLKRIFYKTPIFKPGQSSRYHQLMDWGRNKRSQVMVSKYGVRTRRSDLEMRPLPLEEEEEDETVFDVGNIGNR